MKDWTRASRVEAKPIEWLVPGLIPRSMFSVVAGRPGEGKSIFEAWLTAEVTKQGGSVILSNQEDPIAQVVVPRLEAAGAIMRRVHLAAEPIRVPNDVGSLERKISQTDAQLVIFDAAQQHLTVSVTSGQDVRQATTPLAKMLQRTGAAALFIDHVRKNVNGSAHPLEAVIGAGSGLAAAARLVYLFGTNPKNPDERALATLKSNIGRPRSFIFEFMARELLLAPRGSKRLTIEVGQLILLDSEGWSRVSAADILRWKGAAGNGTAVRAAAKAIAGEWLITLLMGGHKKQSEVQEAAAKCGISYATVRRAADDLQLVKEREGFGRGGYWVWRLPDDHPVLEFARRATGNGGQP